VRESRELIHMDRFKESRSRALSRILDCLEKPRPIQLGKETGALLVQSPHRYEFADSKRQFDRRYEQRRCRFLSRVLEPSVQDTHDSFSPEGVDGLVVRHPTGVTDGTCGPLKPQRGRDRKGP